MCSRLVPVPLTGTSEGRFELVPLSRLTIVSNPENRFDRFRWS
jgi:hypothetical protein